MHTIASTLGTTALAAGLLLGCGPAAAAQTLQGTVMELGTDRPVGAADVVLLDAPDGEVLQRTTTRSSGFFRLDAPSAGPYWVRVSSLGHLTTTDGPATLVPNDTMDVQFRVRVAAIEINGITVWAEAQSPRLETTGFYQRQDVGVGRFVTREDMDEIVATDASDYLERLPGVTVYRGGQAGAPAQIRVRGDCTPSVFVDGFQAGSSIDEVVDIESIEGIEVYVGPSEIPLQYNTTGICGVILVWTR